MNRMFFLGLLGICAMAWCGLAGGCELFEPTISDVSLENISLTYVKLQAMLADTSRKTVLVDVRPEKKYQVAHIPGALNIPLPTIVPDDPRLADAYNIVVYGGDETDLLTPVGAKRFLTCHYSHVFAFRGGLREWRDNGNRVVEAAAATQTQPAMPAQSQPTR